jgi:hypothetical protein
MELPTALDFTRFFDGTQAFTTASAGKVAAKLREIADSLEGKKERPSLILREAHSIHSVADQNRFETTLILRFRYRRPDEAAGDPPDPRKYRAMLKDQAEKMLASIKAEEEEDLNCAEIFSDNKISPERKKKKMSTIWYSWDDRLDLATWYAAVMLPAPQWCTDVWISWQMQRREDYIRPDAIANNWHKFTHRAYWQAEAPEVFWGDYGVGRAYQIRREDWQRARGAGFGRDRRPET